MTAEVTVQAITTQIVRLAPGRSQPVRGRGNDGRSPEEPLVEARSPPRKQEEQNERPMVVDRRHPSWAEVHAEHQERARVLADMLIRSWKSRFSRLITYQAPTSSSRTEPRAGQANSSRADSYSVRCSSSRSRAAGNALVPTVMRASSHIAIPP